MREIREMLLRIEKCLLAKSITSNRMISYLLLIHKIILDLLIRERERERGGERGDLRLSLVP